MAWKRYVEVEGGLDIVYEILEKGGWIGRDVHLMDKVASKGDIESASQRFYLVSVDGEWLGVFAIRVIKRAISYVETLDPGRLSHDTVLAAALIEAMRVGAFERDFDRVFVRVVVPPDKAGVFKGEGRYITHHGYDDFVMLVEAPRSVGGGERSV